MRKEADALFNDHHLAIYRFLLRMTRRREDAEDLTQEVFLRVVRSIETYDGRGLDRAWLFSIARHLLLDRHRRTHRTPDINSDVLVDTLPAHAASQAEAMALDEAIAGLPDLDREALLLREVNGLSYTEIAAVTGATLDAVAGRLYRARLGLRRVWGPPAARTSGAWESQT